MTKPFIESEHPRDGGKFTVKALQAGEASLGSPETDAAALRIAEHVTALSQDHGVEVLDVMGEYDSYPMWKVRFLDGSQYVTRRDDLGDSSSMYRLEAGETFSANSPDHNPESRQYNKSGRWSSSTTVMQELVDDSDTAEDTLAEIDFDYSGQFSGQFMSSTRDAALRDLLGSIPEPTVRS